MYHGIINVYKEPGYTSHDVVARLRGFKQKNRPHRNAGSGGRRCASGMFRNGHKTVRYAGRPDKTYEAVLLLGCSTDTQDTTGTILTENREKALALDPETAEKVILGFKGDYDQIPPCIPP